MYFFAIAMLAVSFNQVETKLKVLDFCTHKIK